MKIYKLISAISKEPADSVPHRHFSFFHFFIFSFFIFAASAVSAQDDISKQLEVTRAYTPKVGQAEKLPVEARMVDTVQLRPEIEYSITPTAWNTAFSSDKYAPASISTTPFEKYRPLYVRAGLGFPLQSTADVYYNSRTGGKNTFGVFVNHRGSYSKLENDLGVRTNATEMSNRLGLYGSSRTGRYTLDGDFGYDIRYYQPYGAANIDIQTLNNLAIFPVPIAAKHFSYDRHFDPFSLGKVGGRIGFGDNFTDLSRFNFRVGLDAGFSHVGSLGSQADVDLRVKLARMVHPKHGFEMELFERGAVDVIEPDISAVTVILSPRYILALDRFRLRAGFDLRYVFNGMHDQNGVDIFPALEAGYDVAGGRFVPFLNVTSHLADGSYEALTRRNPYLGAGGSNHGSTGWVSDLRLGFSGNMNDIFTYRLSGGLSLLNGYQIFVAMQDISSGGSDAYFSPVAFRPEGVTGERYTVGTELGLHNLGGFSARLTANWNKYNLKHGSRIAGDLPKYDMGLEAAYSHKEIFKVRAGIDLIGDRDYHTDLVTGLPGNIRMKNSAGAVVDVSLGAEVKAAHAFWVFLEGRNLANQKLYPYNHYRGPGANVMLGIKAVF